jgi:hypothetical protein
MDATNDLSPAGIAAPPGIKPPDPEKKVGRWFLEGNW